jgi:hypothetical protein
LLERQTLAASVNNEPKRTEAQTLLLDVPKEITMADDLTKHGSPDRDRINVNEDCELRDWSKKFGVTPRN